MAEQGWVYRHPGLDADELLQHLPERSHGWAWSSAERRRFSSEQPWLGDAGQLSMPQREVRWRREGARFAMLVLSLEPLDLLGFDSIPPWGEGRSGWRVKQTPYLLRQSERGSRNAVYFLAPDGSAQWVALIGERNKG